MSGKDLDNLRPSRFASGWPSLYHSYMCDEHFDLKTASPSFVLIYTTFTPKLSCPKSGVSNSSAVSLSINRG